MKPWEVQILLAPSKKGDKVLHKIGVLEYVARVLFFIGIVLGICAFLRLTEEAPLAALVLVCAVIAATGIHAAVSRRSRHGVV